MAWEEWEQLKADAVRMRLDQVPAGPGSGADGPGGGGGAGRLRHTRTPWSRAAATAEDLHKDTGTARTGLRDAHAGLASGAEGLASLGVLRSVLTSWERRLGAVRDECASLEPALRRVARDMGETDVQVGSGFAGAHAPGSRKGE